MQYHMSNYLKALELTKQLEKKAKEATESRMASEEDLERIGSINFEEYPEIADELTNMLSRAKEEHENKCFKTASEIAKKIEYMTIKYAEQKEEERQALHALEQNVGEEIMYIEGFNSGDFPRIEEELDKLLREAKIAYSDGGHDNYQKSLSKLNEIKKKIEEYNPLEDILSDLLLEIDKIRPTEKAEKLAVPDFLMNMEGIFRDHKKNAKWHVGSSTADPFTPEAMVVFPVITTDINGDYVSIDLVAERVEPKDKKNVFFQLYIDVPESMCDGFKYLFDKFHERYREELERMADSKEWKKENKKSLRLMKNRLLSYSVEIISSNFEPKRKSAIFFLDWTPPKLNLSFEYSKPPRIPYII